MKTFKRICFFLAAAMLINLGIEGIFHVNFIERLMINFPLMQTLLKVIALTSGFWLILICCEKE